MNVKVPGVNLLLIGGGGREHALAWKLKQSPLLDRLYCAPGNAGIEEIAECVPLEVDDHAAVARFCKERNIGLAVIGPELPLVAGLADDLEAEGIKVFGPSRAATGFQQRATIASPNPIPLLSTSWVRPCRS